MAVQFSANGDSLANATSTGINFQSAQSPSSITVWINADWLGTSGAKSYVGMYDAKGNIPGGTGTAVQIGTRADGRCDVWTWGGAILISSTGITLANGVWTHIAYTYDGTTHRLYVNGVLNNTSTTTQKAGNFDTVFLNGYTGGVANETATFQVDTYDYYNRTLSADEIMTMYTCMGNRHGIIYGCIARFEFDESSVGSNASLVYNLSGFNGDVSNLLSNSTRTPAVTFAPGHVSGNLRPPQ